MGERHRTLTHHQPNTGETRVTGTDKQKRQQIHEILREFAEEHGTSTYCGVGYVAEKLGCQPIEIFDHNADGGVLFQMMLDGEVGVLDRAGPDPAVKGYHRVTSPIWD